MESVCSVGSVLSTGSVCSVGSVFTAGALVSEKTGSVIAEGGSVFTGIRVVVDLDATVGVI
jgi:hypothetical protein